MEAEDLSAPPVDINSVRGSVASTILVPAKGQGSTAAGLPRLLTPDDVAELLQVSVRWVLSAARNGELPCVRVGRFPRFRPADVEAFIAQGIGR